MNYKTKGILKTTLSAIGGLLVIILILGLCLQFFGTDKVKPSNWIKNDKTSDLVKLERGQVISGVQFDTNKEPDLSVFDVPTAYYGMFPLFDCYEEDGNLDDDPLIVVLDFSAIGNLYGVELKGKCLVYYGEFTHSDTFSDHIIYSDNDISLIGIIADLLDVSAYIKKGWNTSILSENGEFFFNKRVQVVNTYYSDSWNGVYMGALECDGFCKHKEIEQGACKECNKCFHNTLNLNEKCRVCGKEIKVDYIINDFSDFKVKYNQTEQEVFKDIVIKVGSYVNGKEYEIKYPDYKVEDFNPKNFYVGAWSGFNIVYGDCSIYVDCYIECDDPDKKMGSESEYHNTLNLGEICQCCNYSNNIVSIKEVKGFPEQIEMVENIGDVIEEYIRNIELICIDSYGKEVSFNDFSYSVSNYELGNQTIVISLHGQATNYNELQYTINFEFIEEVTNEE